MRSNIDRTASGAGVTADHGPSCGPFEASRNVASSVRFFLPWVAKLGIGLPLFTQDGHVRWAIWKKIPLCFAPSALRSGAPRLWLPLPR